MDEIILGGHIQSSDVVQGAQDIHSNHNSLIFIGHNVDHRIIVIVCNILLTLL